MNQGALSQHSCLQRQKLSVAEVNCDSARIATAKNIESIEFYSRVADFKPSFHYCFTRRQTAKGRGLPSHFIRSSACKKCYPRRLHPHRRAKITQNAQQRAGLAAKSTPPCPGGLTLPTGCHMQKGGSVFVDVWPIFKNSHFFLNRTEPASVSARCQY